ncbi:hypothetical protein MAR_021305 [Mya arenaria]|uniref:Uncharacterized protein n=1 Tax=Mya arenaria TaxID=6604 RepID=A0ABY7EFJ3_MYAAR|nr:hypothetical protein MAR_021305 [Mya arenaria]
MLQHFVGGSGSTESHPGSILYKALTICCVFYKIHGWVKHGHAGIADEGFTFVRYHFCSWFKTEHFTFYIS